MDYKDSDLNGQVNLKPEKNNIILEDIAALTGAFFISENSGYKITEIELDKLGTCKSVISHPKKTLFRGFNKESAANRVEFLKELFVIAENDAAAWAP